MARTEQDHAAITARLAYVEAKIAELQVARRRYRRELERLDEARRIRRMGGFDWEYTATGYDGQVYTGTVVATDHLHAVHRAGRELPGGAGYGLRVRPTVREG
jgi:hypothetical protein